MALAWSMALQAMISGASTPRPQHQLYVDSRCYSRLIYQKALPGQRLHLSIQKTLKHPKLHPAKLNVSTLLTKKEAVLLRQPPI